MKRQRIFSFTTLAILTVTSLALAGCLNPTVTSIDPIGQTLPDYGLISPEEAFAVIQAYQEDPDFVLLDIRTPAEVEAGHLPDAENLDFYDSAFRDDLAALDRNKIYLIYCRTANRTGQAWILMTELGFEKVYDLDGGIRLWNDMGYPICVGAIGKGHTCPVADYSGIN